MLAPKRSKYRKAHKGRVHGLAKGGTTLNVGAYGLKAFEQHAELNRREIDIAGDEQTMPEAARILGKAMGRSLEFAPVPIEEVRKLSADFAVMLEWFDRVGYDVHIRSRSREFGIPPTSLADWAAKARWR